MNSHKINTLKIRSRIPFANLQTYCTVDTKGCIQTGSNFGTQKTRHFSPHRRKIICVRITSVGKFTRSPQEWVPVEELTGTQSINPKAMNKANQRLALFSTPAHSVVQRSLANNCFILSLDIYQSTYFGFNWNDVNLYQQRSAKLILGRVWLAARYLHHIFRWLRIAPALDPAITLTNACLHGNSTPCGSTLWVRVKSDKSDTPFITVVYSLMRRRLVENILLVVRRICAL